MRGVVVVRWARVGHVPTDDPMLDAEARARCASYRLAEDRRRFVGARMLLVQTVAMTVRCDEGDVVLHQRCRRCGGPHGAPAVTVGGRAGPEVSMTHAGDVAAVAVASRAVGVDVEPDGATDDVRAWVRAEAISKATKQGLVATSPPSRRAMRVAELELAPGYVGAIARRGFGVLRVDAAEASIIGAR